MRILFFGDIMGRSGRDGLAKHLPALKAAHKPDAIIANAENAASGSGVTMKLATELFEMGIDVLTMGNHCWAQRELLTAIDREPRIVRPINYPERTPGRGFHYHILPDGRRLMVVNAMARLFMEPVLDDPFAAMEQLVDEHRVCGAMPIILDFHGEATSEKIAMAEVLDGKVSAVLGTHTHIPTADARVLSKGTAFISDVGMCGDYDSIVGMKKLGAIWRFTRKTPAPERAIAEGEATLCGVLIVTDDASGLAKSITPFRVGGVIGERA